MCHFTQRLEQPNFTRLTRNTTRGIDELKLSYFVIRRGDRPVVNAADRGEGRNGEVAREVMEKDLVKMATNVVMGPDGVYSSPDLDDAESPNVELAPHDAEKLRREASEWGRVIYPPLKRQDLVIADMCTSDGESSLASTRLSSLTLRSSADSLLSFVLFPLPL